MKRIIAIVTILLPLFGLSQTALSDHQFPDIISKEKLNDAKFVCEIVPGYWGNDKYNKNMEDYISSEIKTHKVKQLEKRGRKVFAKRPWYRVRKAKGKGDELSSKEKNILASAKTGDWIWIEVKFKHKNAKYEGPEDEHNIITSHYLTQVGS